jgi:hypothetical protein
MSNIYERSLSAAERAEFAALTSELKTSLV